MTFGDALKMYRERINGDADLKPRTKAYYGERIKALLKSWPELEAMDIRKVSETDCRNWAAKYCPTISPTAYNHTLSILRHVLEIGVEVGARYDNPSKKLKRVSESAKKLTLPSAVQFNKFVEAIENGGVGTSRHCADLVRFLAFGGFRKTEAANITWGDVDFEREEITVLLTKNGEPRRVPMIAEMKTLLERLQVESPLAKPVSPVMQVNECQKAMDRAAKEIGMKRITHHDLRHLFATRSIESDVDISTVAKWLGHLDGGALAMRVYGHLRREHSANMAKRVSFSTPQADNITPLPQQVAVA